MSYLTSSIWEQRRLIDSSDCEGFQWHSMGTLPSKCVCVWETERTTPAQHNSPLLFRPNVLHRKGRRRHRKKRKVEEGVGRRSIMISQPHLIGMRSVCVWLHCIPAWLTSFMLPKIKMNARKYPAGMESWEKEETQGEGIPNARGAGWHHIPGARFIITTRYCCKCNSARLRGQMRTVDVRVTACAQIISLTAQSDWKDFM